MLELARAIPIITETAITVIVSPTMDTMSDAFARRRASSGFECRFADAETTNKTAYYSSYFRLITTLHLHFAEKTKKVDLTFLVELNNWTTKMNFIVK